MVKPSSPFVPRDAAHLIDLARVWASPVGIKTLQHYLCNVPDDLAANNEGPLADLREALGDVLNAMERVRDIANRLK